MIQKGDLEFGDVVWAEFDPSVGHEFQNKRPAVVIQANEQLQKSNLVTVIPLTSNNQNITQDDILVCADTINNLRNDSVAKVYCITSFDYSRFSKKIGKISGDIEDSIKTYLGKHFDL